MINLFALGFCTVFIFFKTLIIDSKHVCLRVEPFQYNFTKALGEITLVQLYIYFKTN